MGANHRWPCFFYPDNHSPITEKTIHDEETSNVDVAESMAELKVRLKNLVL